MLYMPLLDRIIISNYSKIIIADAYTLKAEHSLKVTSSPTFISMIQDTTKILVANVRKETVIYDIKSLTILSTLYD